MDLFKRHLTTALAGLCVAGNGLCATDLMISEYIEGSSNNKAVELYNGTDQAIDLAAYELAVYFNGSASAGLTLNLTGSVAPGDVYVVAHSSAVEAILNQADFTTGAGLFNGDDAVVLMNGGVVIDSLGQVGFDPGSEWGSGDTSTQNNTLRRLTSVDAGDSDPADAFDPVLQWAGFPNDSFDDLGQYTTGDGGGEEPTAELGQCGDSATLIHQIQGSAAASPLDGQVVVVEAVVTGLRNNGFFLQEETADQDADPATSEGLFVFSYEAVTPGTTLRVLGTVDEYYELTEITNVTGLLDCGGNTTLAPVTLSLPFGTDAALEPLEGMLVAVNDALVTDINDLWRYGEIGLSDTLKRAPTDVYAPGTAEYHALVQANSENRIYVEDHTSSQYPAQLSFFPNFSYAQPIRVSDRVSTQGPLNFSFGTYRINPLEPIQVVSERPAAPQLQAGNLTLASFNVLNYFNGTDDGNGGVTFDYPENRGAEDQEEFDLQQARIVNAILTLDADVIGLMEIENDGFAGDSAIASLVTALNAQQAADDHYAFVASADGSPVGSDAIAVGLLYRPAVVKPKGTAQTIPMPIQTLADGSLVQMRTALLQTFRHRHSHESFAVVVNHFKSKGSGCWEDANLTDLVTTAQSSCNALRVSAAVTLAQALAAADVPERVMIMGDLNAYSAEDPIAVLTGYDPQQRGYTIMTAVNTAADNGASVAAPTFDYRNVAASHDADGFSYWFYQTGEVGSLDHILVNEAFHGDIVDATHWHINAVEAYQLQYDQALTYYPDAQGYAFTDVGPYRSSDHDPFLVSMLLERSGPTLDGIVTIARNLWRPALGELAQWDFDEDGRITLRDLLAYLGV
ncbi:MAG: ExeM/NucH family extracellular endonuclease [Pseudomonadota bacterium]|nr:ExeM/NucH family extracellular endonuclease [Pseudomonadota bacterium]